MASKAYTVDLRSDTLTKPTESMKFAMVNSALGDDVYGEDPTVNTLESNVAKMLGKQASLFVPTGTMANLIATMVHCNKRGAEMICGDLAHIYKCEQGSVSQLGGVLMTIIHNNPDGTFDLDEFVSHIRGTSDTHEPLTMMVSIENTHNICGGRVVPLDWIDKLTTLAKSHSIAVHMDGARLFNASEYLKVDPARIVRDCDSVSICFSKGLGAPVGSALAGTYHFINQARRIRKALGGGMRQAGVLAAAAIVALNETIPSLYSDHKRAAYIAKGIHDLNLSTFKVDMSAQETNIIMIRIDKSCQITADKVIQRLAQVSLPELDTGIKTAEGEGIILKAGSRDPKAVRLVCHYDINDSDVRLALKKLTHVLKELTCHKGFFG